MEIIWANSRPMQNPGTEYENLEFLFLAQLRRKGGLYPGGLKGAAFCRVHLAFSPFKCSWFVIFGTLTISLEVPFPPVSWV